MFRPVLLILLAIACASYAWNNNPGQKLSMSSSVHTPAVSINRNQSYIYLALGDSYTIGQSVPFTDNYPSQTVRLLDKKGLTVRLQIIAKTGWTTDQLQSAITRAEREGSLEAPYDVVTLLAGVNNQYQGEDLTVYALKFERLLKKAISLANNKPDHVIVLSIPDWGVTPFGNNQGTVGISREIDSYNEMNKELSERNGVSYINVTPGTRKAATDNSMMAVDGLHYSGKEYALWAEKLEPILITILH